MESFAKKIANNWNSKLQLSDIEFIKLQYGVEILLLNISKVSGILLIGLLAGTFVDTLLICILYGVLRLNTFGEHARSSAMCMLVSCITHVGIPFLLSDFVLDINVYLIICCFISLIVYFCAPADTEKHPIIGAEKREKLRNDAITVLMFVVVASVFIPYSRMTLVTLLAQLYVVIAILPITYKILGRKRNNYEEYE